MNLQLLNAEDLGIKLEVAGNLRIWEASPVIRHQLEIDRIRDSIKKARKERNKCQCIDIADIYIQFEDGSLKRPDISIFCKLPNELEEATKEVPEAVIEVISKGYEPKDLEISPPIYLSNGVKDVVVFNPYTMEVVHFKQSERLTFNSPVEIQLACGCNCVV